MAMVCPQCNGAFEQRLNCPKCGVRLRYEAPGRHSSGYLSGDQEAWRHTPWGRIVVGLLLAQGLYYGLRNLLTAGILAASEGATGNVWATLTGLIILQGLQTVGVIGAGLLTGAGQRRGFLLGALLGVWNGVLFLLVQFWESKPLTAINLVGEPTLQVAFGAIGGLAGSLIWRPLPRLALPNEIPSPVPVVPIRKGPSPFAGPIAWGRVITGTALSVGGVVWVDVIREFVLEASEGKLRIDTHLQAYLVTWEISALALLAGSALAGATTRNGLKQGLCVGIVAGVILLGIRMGSLNASPPVLAATLLAVIGLSLLGGWFGGELLPPAHVGPRRKRLRTAPL